MSRPVPALVVGLCSHGLAICRSLGRKGIPVSALESDRRLPGLGTRYAEIELTEDITGPGLIDAIVRVAGRLGDKPVLFLTNDNMVRTVAQHYDRIEATCRFSWPDPDRILQLLSKDNLEGLTRAAGLAYPSTHILSGSRDIDR